MSNQKIELKLAPSNRRRNKNKGNKKINQNTQNLGVRAMKMMGVKIPPSKQQQSRRRKNVNNKMNNGGRIDRFPRGNVQGTNFRSGKISRENDMEYIGEVVSNSTGFSVVNQYACNPGQAATFPWLAKKALLYEKYEFKSLDFIYKPEVTQFASLGTTGKVILSFDYDASDPAPSSKQSAEDTDPSADGMPYEEICLTLKPREMHKNSDAKFVRPGGLPGGSDIKTYDCGNFFVSISGIEANTGTLGELWVRYNCVLSVPVLESTNIAPTNYFVSSQQDVDTTIDNGTGNDVTAFILHIEKNGNDQGTPSEFFGPGLTVVSLHKSIYISCNGTYAITVVINATFTNSSTATTIYRLVAI
jgi:hypothetical protein